MSRWSHAHPENPEGPISHPLAHVEGQADAMRKGETVFPDYLTPSELADLERGEALLAQNDKDRAELDRYIEAQDEIMGCLQAFADALEAGAESIKAMAATLGPPSGAGLQAVAEADRRAERVRNLIARVEGKP